MKGLVIALFTIGLISTIPNYSYAKSKSRTICSVNRAGKVNCKNAKKVTPKMLKIAAAKKCIKSFGKHMFKGRKILKGSKISSCGKKKCAVLKSKCNIN